MSDQKTGMRIGYVAKMFPRLSETFVLNEILELERQGAEVVVFSAKKPNEGQFHPQLARLKAKVLYLEDLDVKKWAHWVSRDWGELAPFGSRIWDLVRQGLGDGAPARIDQVWHGTWIASRARELGLDRLHAHFATLPAALAHMAHRVSGLPYSFTAHAKDIYVYPPEETRLGELIEYADFMVTVTEYNRQHLLGLLPGVDADKIKVIHNGIDLASFEPVPSEQRDPDHVLAVGRLVPKKGFDDLLEACSLLRQRGVGFRCTIAGGGVETANLARRCSELELDDIVTFTGPVRVDAVAELMRRASVFALPCRVAADNNVDALPTVLLESLASGLAAVSTSLSGVPEIITDGQEGMLVPPDDAESLSRALERLLESEALRRTCGENGRTKAVASFDIRRNVAKLHDCFRRGGVERRGSPGTAGDQESRRVLYLCTDRGIPFGGTKGASIHVREFLDGLVAEGQAPQAVMRRRDRSRARDLTYPMHLLSAEQPPPLDATPAVGEAYEHALNAGFVAQLAELHRENPFDCVYERYSLFGSAGREFARRCGLPYVLEVNAPLVVEAAAHRGLQLEPLAREVAAQVFGTADHVIAVSAAIRDHILQIAPQARVTVVPNGVDTDRIRPQATSEAWRRRATGGKEDAFVVGFVGRIRPWHGVDLLLEALAVARERDASLRLCVVGDDRGIGTALQKQARELGIEDAVVFTGAVPPEEIPAALAAMDAVVAPYPELTEFYFSPLKVFEYMAAGKPIVASSIGQIVDVLEHERTALLVPPGDATILAGALLRLHADPHLTDGLGRNAREEAVANHAWRDRVRTVLSIFSDIRQPGAVAAS